MNVGPWATSRNGRFESYFGTNHLEPPYWEPTALADVAADARVAVEEPFGPVAPRPPTLS